MGKKPFLVPIILGVLFAVSAITACDELPGIEIRSINLSDVWPQEGGTPEGLEEKNRGKSNVQYTRTASWVNKNTNSTIGNQDLFVKDVAYEAVFSLTAIGGCFFNVSQDNIKLPENKYSSKKLEVEHDEETVTRIKVIVVFLPVEEVESTPVEEEEEEEN
jgi:hypothetical protein